MKKTLVIFAALVAMVSSAFAFSMGERFVEVRVNLPASVSNNGISLNDIMQEEAIIDFVKINESIKNNDLNFKLFTSPEVDLNLRFGKKVRIGFQAGVDANVEACVTKEAIELFAKGNPDGGPLSAGGGFGGDIFAYSRMPVYMKIKKLELTVTPTVFVPMVHVVPDNINVTVENDEDGTFNITGKAGVTVYSALSPSEFDMNNFNMSNIQTDRIFGNSGADLAIAAKYPVLKQLKVGCAVQVPVLPGKLLSKSTVGYQIDFKKNLFDSSKDSEDVMMLEEMKTEAYSGKLHRPLTFMAGVDYEPVKDTVFVNGSVGFGLKNPFSSESVFYPQYTVGAKVNLINLVAVSASTQYVNQVFSHNFGAMINLRIVELDVGASLTGTSLPASFTMQGLGGYVTLCVGI